MMGMGRLCLFIGQESREQGPQARGTLCLGWTSKTLVTRFQKKSSKAGKVALMTHGAPTAILSCPSFKDPEGPAPPQVSMYAVRAPPSLTSTV